MKNCLQDVNTALTCKQEFECGAWSEGLGAWDEETRVEETRDKNQA